MPFWPQPPNSSCYEDMHVQAAEHFPGFVLDLVKRTLRFSLDRFTAEIETVLENFDAMFCFQCQETARNTGCMVRGVCGKPEETADLLTC